MSIAIGIAAILFAAAPASSQDYLGTHLDTVRDNNLRQHQIDNQQANPRKRNRTATTAPATRRPTQAERQAAWSRNKTEYRRRMLRDGPAAADRWLDQQIAARPASRLGIVRHRNAGP